MSGQVEELKKIHADHVIVSTEEDVVQRVKEITGEGAAGMHDDANPVAYFAFLDTEFQILASVNKGWPRTWSLKVSSSACADVAGGRGAYAGLEPVGGDVTARIVSSVRDQGMVNFLLQNDDSMLDTNRLIFRGRNRFASCKSVSRSVMEQDGHIKSCRAWPAWCSCRGSWSKADDIGSILKPDARIG